MKIGLTHDQLADNLAQHLLRDDRIVWTDIPAGRQGSCRPDVYTIQKSYTQPNPTSYEIKVSVSDFRSDVTSGKWQKYLEFSHAVVFCVPKGLVTKKDTPKGCGLMTFNGEFWNTVKRPTIQPETHLNSELLLKLLIEGKDRQVSKETVFESIPVEDDLQRYDNWKAVKKKWGDDIRTKLHFMDTYQERYDSLYHLKKQLIDILDLDVATKKEIMERFSVDSDIRYSIEKILKAADEDERKKEIAKELRMTKGMVDRNFNGIIERFGLEDEEDKND